MEAWSGHWIPAVLINLALGAVAWAAGSVRKSGFLGGLVVGVPIYLFLGWRGFSVLLAMFVVGTALTRFGYAKKEQMGVAEEQKGARGASHALANAGVAALLAVLTAVLQRPELAVGFVAALATASMDTAGSEVGPLWGRRTISLKTFRPVPPGTEGAVSLEGTLGGFLAAGILAGVGWATGLLPAGMLTPVLGAAWIGNLYEGLLGSRKLLPHSWLNATNTLVGALSALLFAGAFTGGG